MMSTPPPPAATTTNSNCNLQQVSKRLSWLLRHGAEKEGISVRPDGFVRVADILKHPRYVSTFTMSMLHEVVQNDAKQRYTLRKNGSDGEYEIRANQGHSLRAVDAAECMTRIMNAEEVHLAVHGTYYRHWPSIRSEGLKRMNRNHVHFAVSDANPKSSAAALSGFRSDCQLLIYVNVELIIKDGLELFRSANNVILCAGSHGCIAPKYFTKVVDRRTGTQLKY